MCHADDRALAEHDHALPGLDLILDAPWLRTELDALLPTRVTGLEVTSVRYKPGMSCLVGLDLMIDGVRTHASAQLFGPGQQDKFQKYKEQACRSASQPAQVFVLKGAAIAVWLWPFDGELDALSALEDPKRRSRLLGSCLGNAVETQSLSLETLRYKPQRRWTARVHQNGQSRALIKVSSYDRFAASLHAAQRAHAIGALNAPRVMGSSRRRAAMGLAWIPGEQLGERIAAGTVSESDLHSAGTALAHLHRIGIRPAWKLPSCSIEPRLDAARRAIAALVPQLEQIVQQVARSVMDDLTDLPQTIVHGDCSADQVLIASDGASLIDWDRMATGPPVVDLGRFAATLIMTDLAAQTKNAAEIMSPIIEAYRDASDRDPRHHLPAATALALLELACEPFRRRTPGWGDLVSQAVRAASDQYETAIHGA